MTAAAETPPRTCGGLCPGRLRAGQSERSRASFPYAGRSLPRRRPASVPRRLRPEHKRKTTTGEAAARKTAAESYNMPRRLRPNASAKRLQTKQLRAKRRRNPATCPAGCARTQRENRLQTKQLRAKRRRKPATCSAGCARTQAQNGCGQAAAELRFRHAAGAVQRAGRDPTRHKRYVRRPLTRDAGRIIT